MGYNKGTEPCGLRSRDADSGKPLGMAGSRTDGNGDGVCGVLMQNFDLKN